MLPACECFGLGALKGLVFCRVRAVLCSLCQRCSLWNKYQHMYSTCITPTNRNYQNVEDGDMRLSPSGTTGNIVVERNRLGCALIDVQNMPIPRGCSGNHLGFNLCFYSSNGPKINEKRNMLNHVSKPCIHTLGTPC